MASLITRLALLGVGASTVVAAAALASPIGSGVAPGGAAIALSLATAGLIASLVVLGGHGRRGGGGVWIAAGTVVVVVGGGLTAALLMGSDPASTSQGLIGGLPPPAALLVYGVGLVPALVVPLVYAWTFGRSTLTASDVAQVREAAAARLAGGDATDDDSP